MAGRERPRNSGVRACQPGALSGDGADHDSAESARRWRRPRFRGIAAACIASPLACGASSFTVGAVPSPAMAETAFPETGLEFGVFDWIESSAATPAEIFEHKLQIAETADAAGFRGWHL